MSKTRREFLITASTGVAAGLLSPKFVTAQGTTAATTGALRVRKNVVSAAAASDLASLRRGVAAMKQLYRNDPRDPRGWALQAFIHGNCNSFTSCQHRNWYFPPWHRSFIFYFEALIQFFASDPNFALPYWDWSRTHSVPASFFGSGNPLDDDLSLRTSPAPTNCPNAPTAGRGVTPTTQFTQPELDAFVGLRRINEIQSNPDYATYGGANPGTGALEGTPHNFVHRWVGGAKGSNMVQTFSPMDPIFWMHHCNIDRLYSNWLSRGFAPPLNDPAWRDRSFNDFYDSNKNRVGSQYTCGMTVDSRVMGYVYDTLAAMPMALTVQRRTSGNAEVKASVAASKAVAKAGVLSFVTDAPPPAETRQLLTAAAVGSTADQVVRLTILNVKRPRQQNTAVHVFIGPDVTAQTPITAPGYVGSFTFFEGEVEAEPNAAGGHEHSRTVLFNATAALRDLYGDTNLPEGVNLTVSIVTRPLTAGVQSFASVEEIRPDRIQIDVVNLNA